MYTRGFRARAHGSEQASAEGRADGPEYVLTTHLGLLVRRAQVHPLIGRLHLRACARRAHILEYHCELRQLDRKCTDIPCCIVFLAFLVTVVGLGYVGFMEGDTSKLATPYDWNGRECG